GAGEDQPGAIDHQPRAVGLRHVVGPGEVVVADLAEDALPAGGIPGDARRRCRRVELAELPRLAGGLLAPVAGLVVAVVAGDVDAGDGRLGALDAGLHGLDEGAELLAARVVRPGRAGQREQGQERQQAGAVAHQRYPGRAKTAAPGAAVFVV